MKNGSRRVTHITEVCGLEGDRFTLQDVFQRGEAGGKPGELLPTGLVPRLSEKLSSRGHSLPPSLFSVR